MGGSEGKSRLKEKEKRRTIRDGEQKITESNKGK